MLRAFYVYQKYIIVFYNILSLQMIYFVSLYSNESVCYIYKA